MIFRKRRLDAFENVSIFPRFLIFFLPAFPGDILGFFKIKPLGVNMIPCVRRSSIPIDIPYHPLNNASFCLDAVLMMKLYMIGRLALHPALHFHFPLGSIRGFDSNFRMAAFRSSGCSDCRPHLPHKRLDGPQVSENDSEISSNRHPEFRKPLILKRFLLPCLPLLPSEISLETQFSPNFQLRHEKRNALSYPQPLSTIHEEATLLFTPVKFSRC
jgi:hypothetical protein